MCYFGEAAAAAAILAPAEPHGAQLDHLLGELALLLGGEVLGELAGDAVTVEAKAVHEVVGRVLLRHIESIAFITHYYHEGTLNSLGMTVHVVSLPVVPVPLQEDKDC